MKYITRWALMRCMRQESLSEHTADTALLAHALCLIARNITHTGADIRPDTVAAAALYHDAPEILTGDMPTPVKYKNEALRTAYKAVERESALAMADLLPPELRRQKLFPVGRLDKDTEGLLLLTNEGGLAHELLSPRHHVDKVYYARTAGRLTEEDCRAFAAGMTLDDGLACLPAGLEILSAGEESEAYVTLREGKFHQVKRMLAQRGKPVVYLERVRMGNLPLDPALEPGTYRYLTEDEVESLRNF